MVRVKNLLLQLVVTSSFLCGCANIEKAKDGEEKFLVVTSGKGHGLSNRLRVLASASVIAKQTGRTLVLNWQPSEKELPARFNDLYTNKIPSIEDKDINLAQAKKINLNTLNIDGVIKTNISKDDSAKTIEIESYFRFINQGHFFSDIQDDYVGFLRSLDPVDIVKKRVSEFIEKHPQTSTCTGVHFRGFVLSADNRFKGKNSLEKRRANFLSTLNRVYEESGQTCFFVATDDRSMLEQIKGIFTQNVFHQELQVSRASIEDVYNSMVDWYLLAHTYKIVGTEDSSFSDEASLLTKSGIKIGVGPRFF